MDFQTVKQIFGELYEELRELNGENAPNSYTWLAPSIGELSEECGGLPQDCEEANETEAEAEAASELHAARTGSGEAVAWIYECHERTVTRVGANASREQVENLLRNCLDLTATE